MTAVRMPLCACCLALLLWLCTALPAQAHTLITLTLEMVAEGDELTIDLSVSPLDIMACLAAKSPPTRGQLRALGPLLGPYLLGRIAVDADGVALSGAYGGYLPDLLQPGAAITADEALPAKLSFVLTWRLPASAVRVRVAPTLFTEEGLPGFCQLILAEGPGRKRQVAYVELGKSWTFALQGGAAAAPAPMPPALSQALLPGNGAPPAATTVAPTVVQLIGGGLAALPGWLPLLLAMLLVALQPATLRAVLLHCTLFAGTLLLGLAWISGRGNVPGPAPAALLAAGAVVAVALANLSARLDARAGARLTLVAVAGLLHGWALSAPAGSGAAALDGSPGRLLYFALGLGLGALGLVGLAVGTTAWSWGGAGHRRYVVIPASLLATLLVTAWAVQRVAGHPPLPG